MVAPYESYVAVCEQLNALTPGEHEKRSALFNSGAEAVENAVKIARHATGRPAVVVFDHAYHGRTNLTMALTAKNMPYKHRFGPFAGEVYRVPMSYPLRDGGLSGAAGRAHGPSTMIEKQVGAANVAAVLIEPIQGEGGFVVPAPGFPARAGGLGPAAGALFIADEIQTGFCRTGDWFACEHEGVVPDLVTTGQGHRRRAAAGRGDRPGRDHGRGARRAGWAARTAATRSPARPRWPPSRPCASWTWPPRPGGSRRWWCPRLRALAAGDRASARSAAGARCSPSSWSLPGTARRPGPGPATAAIAGGLPRGRPARADLRHLRQRAALPAPAGDLRRAAGPGPGRPRRRLRLSRGRRSRPRGPVHGPLRRRQRSTSTVLRRTRFLPGSRICSMAAELSSTQLPDGPVTVTVVARLLSRLVTRSRVPTGNCACPGGRTYYSIDVGAWHVISLDETAVTSAAASRAPPRSSGFAPISPRTTTAARSRCGITRAGRSVSSAMTHAPTCSFAISTRLAPS